jgi:mRNA interferase MazF
MKGGMMYDQRDVVLIPFPYSDLTGAKQRPALILSNMKLNKSDDRICCLITSKKAIQGITISQNSFDSGTLPFQSWIKPDRLFTIHQKIIRKRLCTVTKKFHQKVLSSVNQYISPE